MKNNQIRELECLDSIFSSCFPYLFYYLFWSSATRSLHPLSVPDQAIEDEVKATSPLKKFTSLPHHSEQLTKAASVTSVTVKTDESKEFRNRKNKSTLMQEGRESIKASMKRNIGNPFELKRLSPGGPDPHHH
ncbi:hypothetical protein V6N13_081932 [Hibiscus sabdariffa]